MSCKISHPSLDAKPNIDYIIPLFMCNLPVHHLLLHGVHSVISINLISHNHHPKQQYRSNKLECPSCCPRLTCNANMSALCPLHISIFLLFFPSLFPTSPSTTEKAQRQTYKYSSASTKPKSPDSAPSQVYSQHTTDNSHSHSHSVPKAV